MSEQMTLARPYAQAAFNWAREKNSLGTWQTMLSHLSLLLSHEEIKHFVKRSRSAPALQAGLKMLTEGWVDEDGLRFLNVLVENHRFELLPFILAQFIKLKLEHEQVMPVSIQTPFALSDALLSDLEKALHQRLGRKVVFMGQTIVPDLIAGIQLRFGDQVLDGSLLGRFQNLKSVLMAV